MPGFAQRAMLSPNAIASSHSRQIEKPDFHLREQARRDETVAEISRLSRHGAKTAIRPLINIVFGDYDPTRFVIKIERWPHARRQLDPDRIAGWRRMGDGKNDDEARLRRRIAGGN